jgi:superfamily II DNA or RNA helicase
MSAGLQAPSTGQLVTVRRRRWVVIDSQASTQPVDPLSGAKPQHLVDLSSVEDDGFGEELRVVWELEPGARAFDRATLPDAAAFDPPACLDAFLDAVRWGTISSADVRLLNAPFRSGISIEDYQLDPLVRALEMPRVNLLIADDVGLGKTIEAGLVAQELMLRHRARSVLIVCPAGLQLQWRDQMRDKFGLEFRIVDSQLLRDLRRRRGLHVNPWSHHPRLIASIDFLKRDRPLRQFRELLPPEGQPAFPRLFDLLIVDEAHNVAPSGSGRYAVDSLRTQAIRALAPHFEHKLFLTATPHNGYSESFTSLLELLDDQRFHRGLSPDPRQLAAVMVRRLKRELRDERHRFPLRKLEAIPVEYTDAERRAHQALRDYSDLRLKSAGARDQRFAVEFVLKMLKKRLFSSPAAFRTTLEKHLASVRAGQKRALDPLARLRRYVDGAEDEAADDDERLEEEHGEAVHAAGGLLGELSGEERSLLDELEQYSQKAVGRPDSKAGRLIEWLKQTLKPGGQWNDERAIIFTEYRATQNWLHGLLAAAGLAEEGRLSTIFGGMDDEERERVKAAFQADPKKAPVRILLATDAASEGIDLQNHCHRLVHYEIPWNPNRMEQRNGRIDRHGQRAEHPLIHHFVGAGFQAADAREHRSRLEDDLEFLKLVAEKVEAIREDLGKVGPVLAQQVEEAMLGRRSRIDTSQAEREAEPARRLLKLERSLREQVEKARAQLDETRADLGISPESVKRAVDEGLALAGQPALREARLEGVWPDPTGQRKGCPVFFLPKLTGTWAACADGLADPHTHEVRPIVFDHAIAQGRQDVVLVHLNHRLVQMCLGLLRAEVWSQGGAGSLNRVTARSVPQGLFADPVVVAHGRIVVLGADNARLYEELVFAGGRVRDGRFARVERVGDLRAALQQAGEAMPEKEIQAELLALWPKVREPLLASLEARMRERHDGLAGLLERRAKKEAEDLADILTELKRTIELELGRPVEQQLSFAGFSDEERGQRELDLASLRHRAEAIPGEIQRETEAIRRRYAGPTPRLFPVAVTWLVPEKGAR